MLRLDAFSADTPLKRQLLEQLPATSDVSSSGMDVDSTPAAEKKAPGEAADALPEVEAYLRLLVLVWLIDEKYYEKVSGVTGIPCCNRLRLCQWAKGYGAPLFRALVDDRELIHLRHRTGSEPRGRVRPSSHSSQQANARPARRASCLLLRPTLRTHRPHGRDQGVSMASLSCAVSVYLTRVPWLPCPQTALGIATHSFSSTGR